MTQTRCALCGAKDVSEPRGRGALLPGLLGQEDRGRRDRRARVRAQAIHPRSPSAEKYLIYHSTLKRPCGQLIVVDDGYDLFLTMLLYPSFAWDEAAYYLEGDPEGRSFAEILVDVVAAEVIEPWGGGKWHLENLPILQPGTGRLERGDVEDYNPAASAISFRRSEPDAPRQASRRLEVHGPTASLRR